MDLTLPILKLLTFWSRESSVAAQNGFLRWIKEIAFAARTSDKTYHHCMMLGYWNQLPLVWADAVQLQQVLLNLILNALEAMIDCPVGEREVVLRAMPCAAEAEVEITVTDQGHGFAKEKLAKLFEPFITTKEDGMGIGLMVCQTIIGAHGGQFTAENNPDRGATVRFTLPKGRYIEEKSARATERLNWLR